MRCQVALVVRLLFTVMISLFPLHNTIIGKDTCHELSINTTFYSPSCDGSFLTSLYANRGDESGLITDDSFHSNTCCILKETPYGFVWIVVGFDGSILDTDCTEGTEPFLSMTDDHTMVIRIGSGNAFWFKFYDLEDNRVTSVYQSVLAVNNGIILYTDWKDHDQYLIAETLYDSSILYMEQIEMAHADGLAEEVSWDENTRKYTIRYLNCPDQVIEEAVIDLSPFIIN